VLEEANEAGKTWRELRERAVESAGKSSLKPFAPIGAIGDKKKKK
jgi:hypothetical protein